MTQATITMTNVEELQREIKRLTQEREAETARRLHAEEYLRKASDDVERLTGEREDLVLSEAGRIQAKRDAEKARGI